MRNKQLNILAFRENNPLVNSMASDNRFLCLAEGLAQNGCNIDLILLRNITGSDTNIIKQAEMRLQNRMRFIYAFPLYTRNVFFNKVLNRYVLTSRIHSMKINNLIRHGKYDYVWLDTSPEMIAIGMNLINARHNVKYFHERSEFSWIGLGGKKQIHDNYLRIFLPKIDVMSVMTIALQNYYKQYIGADTKMIHLPMTVDLSRIPENIPKKSLNKPYIGYCGPMSIGKDGVHILIQAFIKIMTQFPHVHLYLAGPLTPKRDFKILKSIITNNNANSRITILGYLLKEEMPVFLTNACVLALARLRSKQAEGNFPTKLGEFLATGKPVCVTRVGEIDHYLKDNESVYFAMPGSVESFANALSRALTSKEANRVGESGRDVAFRNFNKDVQAKALYDCLLKNR